MTRLAVVTADRVRVMEGRRQVAVYAMSSPVAEDIEWARTAPEAPMPEPEQPRRPVVGYRIPTWGQL